MDSAWENSSQYQRQGPKAQTDICDVERLIVFAVPGVPELDFGHMEELKTALADLLKNWPGMRHTLKPEINNPAIFDNWDAPLSSLSEWNASWDLCRCHGGEFVAWLLRYALVPGDSMLEIPYLKGFTVASFVASTCILSRRPPSLRRLPLFVHTIGPIYINCTSYISRTGELFNPLFFHLNIWILKLIADSKK